MHRILRSLAVAGFLFLCAPGAQAAETPAWEEIVAKARGQTVYFHAWAGDERNNALIRWIGDQVRDRFAVTLEHVKINDTMASVTAVLAEKAAGRDQDGTVDLIWINGESFRSMKEKGILFGPFTQLLPNFALVDTMGKPSTIVDFAVPTEGYESPWRMAQIVFPYDSARVSRPPQSIAELLAWAEAHPGRFTYPNPRNFLGSTFLKQALYELTPDPKVLQSPAIDTNFATVTASLWPYLDQLHPALWRGGKTFPENGPAMRQLLNDSEIDISISFNPSEASVAIVNGLLPDTVRTFVLKGGTIGNTNFVGIPYNARAKEGAMVVANFMLSPECQAYAQNPKNLGAFTVLDLKRLSPAQRKLLDDLPLGVATLSYEELGVPLPEPHPSWMVRVAAEWQRRYGK